MAECFGDDGECSEDETHGMGAAGTLLARMAGGSSHLGSARREYNVARDGLAQANTNIMLARANTVQRINHHKRLLQASSAHAEVNGHFVPPMGRNEPSRHVHIGGLRRHQRADRHYDFRHKGLSRQRPMSAEDGFQRASDYATAVYGGGFGLTMNPRFMYEETGTDGAACALRPKWNGIKKREFAPDHPEDDRRMARLSKVRSS